MCTIIQTGTNQRRLMGREHCEHVPVLCDMSKITIFHAILVCHGHKRVLPVFLLFCTHHIRKNKAEGKLSIRTFAIFRPHEEYEHIPVNQCDELQHELRRDRVKEERDTITHNEKNLQI